MNTRTPSPVPSALDARYYTDPEMYRRECRGLFGSTWHFAGHASALERAGDYFAFDIAGESLFCIRDRAGGIRAFYNVCQHRAHELVRGNGNCRFIVCPYHAWTYELDGSLRGAANQRAMPGFPKDRVRLAEVPVENLCGFLFVNPDPDARPMADWFPGVEAELRAFVPHIDRLKPLEWVDVDEACNWKVSVENYCECYHCALNHPTFSTGVIKPQTYDIRPQGYCLRHTTECQNLDRMTYPIDPGANPHAGSYSSWFLWPMFSFQVYPGNVLNTYHWRPRGVDRVTVRRGWYTIDGAESDVIRRLAQQDRQTTVEEDVHLVESVQRGLNSKGYRPGPLLIDPGGGVNSEHSLHALHGWIREALDDDAVCE